MRNMKKGFTLVELIVVIVILAILATIAFISLRDYPVQARDSKRISEIGSLADKANILLAEHPEKLLALASGTLSNTNVNIVKKDNNDTVNGGIASINFDTLWVPAENFKSPISTEEYKIIILTWSTDDGTVIKCFEFWAMEEKTSSGIFTKGNCAQFVDTTKLFNRNNNTDMFNR